MKSEDFIAIILTHGRPDNMPTYNTLRRAGYTGPICVLIDNEDSRRADYEAKYGKEVVVFDKAERAKSVDSCDNFPNRKAIVWGRNECYDVAKRLGYRYFMQLDDDYTDIHYRINAKGEYGYRLSRRFDDILAGMLTFYKSISAKAIAFAQGGDFIGGSDGSFGKGFWLKRKCMNSWLCDVERPIKFNGRMNEDASAYILGGLRGELFLQVSQYCIIQRPTQATAGGMTELYLASGTYVKTFYSVMQAPSCVKVYTLSAECLRIHHRVSWNNCSPKILSETVRKPSKK